MQVKDDSAIFFHISLNHFNISLQEKKKKRLFMPGPELSYSNIIMCIQGVVKIRAAG
jgi:hypothetical protein